MYYNKIDSGAVTSAGQKISTNNTTSSTIKNGTIPLTILANDILATLHPT